MDPANKRNAASKAARLVLACLIALAAAIPAGAALAADSEPGSNGSTDVTLIANYYEVVFDANDDEAAASATMDTMRMSPDEDYVLPECKYTKPYYVFTGWNTKADGSGTSYDAGESVRNLAQIRSEVTLYAQWDPWILRMPTSGIDTMMLIAVLFLLAMLCYYSLGRWIWKKRNEISYVLVGAEWVEDAAERAAAEEAIEPEGD